MPAMTNPALLWNPAEDGFVTIDRNAFNTAVDSPHMVRRKQRGGRQRFQQNAVTYGIAGMFQWLNRIFSIMVWLHRLTVRIGFVPRPSVETIERIRSRYFIQYPAPPAEAGAFRKIRVELAPAAQRRHPDATILARAGYYATASQ